MQNIHSLHYHKYSLFKAYKNHISLSFSTYALIFRSLIITPEALHGAPPRAALFCRSRAYLKPPEAMTTDTSTIKGLIIWRARKGPFSLRKAFSTCAIIYAKKANTWISESGSSKRIKKIKLQSSPSGSGASSYFIVTRWTLCHFFGWGTMPFFKRSITPLF